MKKENVLKLKKNDTISHLRYGKCTVDEVIISGGALFGVAIIPLTEDGKHILASDSGTNIKRFLEDNNRFLGNIEQ